MSGCDPFEHCAGYIKLVDCRHSMHVTMCDYVPPAEPRIDRINEHCYYVRSTSEIRFYEHGESGTKRDHDRSVKRAFSNLKKLINCNYDTPANVRFITLTYAENMRDNSRISDDWRRFLRRCKGRYGSFRWLYVKEQQGRGAWHLHCLLFFDGRAPYMDNDEVRGMWGYGFVNVRAVKGDANNLGHYLCAYLTDDEETRKKGSRLSNYDAGVRLYNCSRDIRRPAEQVISFERYLDMLHDDELVALSDRDYVVQSPGHAKRHVRYQIFRTLH